MWTTGDGLSTDARLLHPAALRCFRYFRPHPFLTDQCLAIAASEVCTRILVRDNTATIRWTPAHLGVEGNEMADTWARVAAERKAHTVDRFYMLETSLSHMTRKTAKAKTRAKCVLQPPPELF